jgi:agmatinase
MSHFMGLPGVAAEEADVLFVSVPLEATVSYESGTSRGPEGIYSASEHLEFLDETLGWCPYQHLELHYATPIVMTDGEVLADHHARIDATVAALPNDRANLLIGLGGEHAITPGLVRPRMPDGGHVIQIDAHADFRREYHGSVFNHACPMFRLREMGYEITMIGIRSFEPDEWDRAMADPGVAIFTDDDLQRGDAFEELLAHLDQLEGPLYLTVDVDGLDPSLVGSTGTPQPGGLHWYQMLDIVDAICGNPDVDLRGLDIVELIPDEARVSSMTVAKLIHYIISHWAWSKGYAERPAIGGQLRVEDE